MKTVNEQSRYIESRYELNTKILMSILIKAAAILDLALDDVKSTIWPANRR